MNIADMSVMVTGAGSGIGQAIAIGFAKEGARVFGLGRTESRLKATAAEAGERFTFIVGDVADAADVARAMTQVEDEAGRLDVLINNAALYPKKPLLEVSPEEFRRAVDTNITGVALCCQAALPGMLKRGYGRILNVGSFAWKAPIPASAAYAASKAGVLGLTRAIASEIDPRHHPNVIVNEWMPLISRTAMSDGGAEPRENYPLIRAVVALPSGSPTGHTYVGDQLHEEHTPGTRARVKRLLKRTPLGQLLDPS